jgi:hypothetical protein
MAWVTQGFAWVTQGSKLPCGVRQVYQFANSSRVRLIANCQLLFAGVAKGKFPS